MASSTGLHGISSTLMCGLTAELYSSHEIRTPQKAVLQVTDTGGYHIHGCETAQQIGCIYFPRITTSNLTQPPKINVHLKAITVNATKQEKKQNGYRSETPKYPTT